MHLKAAIDGLQNYILAYPGQVAATIRDECNGISQSYDMMVSTWRRGLPDTMRGALYAELTRRCYQAAAQLKTDRLCTTSSCLRHLHDTARSHRNDWSYDALRSSLETFVAERDMLEIEPPHTRQAKELQLYQTHGVLMDDVFNYFVTLGPMGRFAADVRELVTAPTIDPIDQQLLVSAITVALLDVFDMAKLEVLAHAYLHAPAEAVRQRALVGLALGSDDTLCRLYPEMAELMQRVAREQPAFLQELTELQMQMVFSLETENDARDMHDRVLPDIIRNSRLRITPHGIEEMDDDPTEDMLHPEQAEQRMEAMEKAMRRMADMVKQGSDIYFGGFSQTKRQAFFSAVSNWFVPFYTQHPGIQQAWQQSNMQRLVERMLSTGGLCDSDRYSFVLLFHQVQQQLPQNVLEMMRKGEVALMDMQPGDGPGTSPAYLRRAYLQNLYRFYRIHTARADFASPFADNTYLFFTRIVLAGVCNEQHVCEVASFLMKHRRTADAARLLSAREGSMATAAGHLLCAYAAQRCPEVFAHDAEYHYGQAMKLDPDSVRAIAGKARCLYEREDYAEAGRLYGNLAVMRPQNTTYQLSAAACQACRALYDEALATLFRISYEQPDNADAERVLAWTLMAAGRSDEALRHYDRLTANGPAADGSNAEDMQNRAYCLWLCRRMDEAVAALCASSMTISQSDERFLVERGIEPTEIALMREQVTAAGPADGPRSR